jgi:hypothetical protein
VTHVLPNGEAVPDPTMSKAMAERNHVMRRSALQTVVSHAR